MKNQMISDNRPEIPEEELPAESLPKIFPPLNKSGTSNVLLFDIDGTLLLTGGAGKISFEKAFEEQFGIPNCWGDTKPDGKTDPAIIREIATKHLGRALDQDEYETLCEHYLACFRDEIRSAPQFRLLPGIENLLAALSQDERFFLGIATGNLEEAAWLKLERGEIRDYFRFGGFGSDSMARATIVARAKERAEQILKCAIRPSELYVIGDTPHDITAAKQVGAKSIVVATGNNKLKDLSPHNPTHLLSDLTDLDKFLNFFNRGFRPRSGNDQDSS